MRDTPRVGVAAIALVCGIAFAVSAATAQTSSPTAPDAAGASSAATSPAQPQAINPSPDQAQALLKELADFVTQSVSGFQPSVGAPVPPDLDLQPMPPGAAAALPEAKDHHVAKTDDQTILIVDPVSRQVVGVVSVSSDDGTTGLGNPQADSDSSKQADSDSNKQGDPDSSKQGDTDSSK